MSTIIKVVEIKENQIMYEEIKDCKHQIKKVKSHVLSNTHITGR